MATSRAERGIARHVLVGQASCLSHLIDGMEARPTGIKGWKPVLPPCITLRSLLVMGTKLFMIAGRDDMCMEFIQAFRAGRIE
ncbi:MAG: hypothetical protein ACLQPD_07115 [Desulfomonilaceae bacterium]